MGIIIDTDDLGTDVAVLSDLAPVWGIASGKVNLAYALARRYSTPRGGLFCDLEYGYDVSAWINAALAVGAAAGGQLASLQSALGAEARKDRRVQSAEVTLDFSFDQRSLSISHQIDSADGPFDLVLLAGEATVDVLRIDGVQLATVATTAPTSVIVGPVGPQGPAGAPGASGGGGGGGGASLALDDGAAFGSTAGTEEVVRQWDAADFGALATGSLTAELAASVFSASGTATFRLRLGGSDGVADGTILATITHALASFLGKNAGGTFTNPTGLQFVKVTAQSSGSGVDARIKGPVVTFR